MSKQIKCMKCQHIWSSKATDLKNRGIYCRNCGNKDKEFITWVSEYTDTELKYTKTLKEKTDFLQPHQSAQELKVSEDIQKSTKDTKTKTKIGSIEEEDKKQLFVDKMEKVVSKTGKGKYRNRSLGDLMEQGLKIFESVQNRRFEESGYSYRYEDEHLRKDMIEAFNEAYGVELELSPKQELAILSLAYATPTIYHEIRYKSLGVKIKTFISKSRAKLKERQMKRTEAKLSKKAKKEAEKPLSQEDIEKELKELDKGTET